MRSGEVIDGCFEIEHLVGEGGMGSVYRARDQQSGQLAAVKVLHRASGHGVERFAREARVLATLTHPGIVAYLGHGTTPGGAPYLAMEWLAGEDLGTRLERGAQLGIDESLALVERVAEALDFAHRRGVVHRDIKPGNLFLLGGDLTQVKIVDFGLAHISGDPPLTTAGRLVGTPSYMAPEQVRGSLSLDARADIFSLGCVLFQCLTGESPFHSPHAMAVLTKILLDDPPALRDKRPGVPGELDELLARMLAKEREQRPADGGAVVREIAALRQGAGAPASELPSVTASLTTTEQRIMSVVMAAGPERAPAASPADDYEREQQVLQQLRDAAGPYDVHVERLRDGSMVAMISGDGMPTEQTVRAARCALAMRAAQSGMAVVLATGRGVARRRVPLGEVIDRAVALVAAAPREAIRIDELTAGLLDARFEVRRDEQGLSLHAESEVPESVRTLLGKPAPYVGRARELAQIEAVCDWCMSEPAAGVMMVTAEAGIGKSRLRYESVRRLQARYEGLTVLVAAGDLLSAGSAYALLAPALRRWAGILAGEQPAVSRQKLRTRIGRHVAEAERQRVTELMGELMGVHFPADNSPWLVAARSDARLMADQVRAAWESWLRAECEAQPVLLVLEDLHWGDLPTVQLVDAALRSLSQLPLMVLALARPSVHQRFPNLWPERDVTEVKLRGLSAKACEQLVQTVLDNKLIDDQIARLVEQSGGNAFYLEELIRAAREGRVSELPESVLGMVQARLSTLESDARRVLRSASVFGEVFWPGAVAALLGGEQHLSLVQGWLDELAAREIISVQPAAAFPQEREYRFRHSVVREAAYAMLTEADRELGHRLAGVWLEQMGEQDALVLAEHFRLGSAPQHAIGWYRRAAQEALDGNDLDAALSLAERGAECGASGQALCKLRLVSSEACYWRGELAPALDAAVEASGCFNAGSNSWFRATGRVVVAASRLGRQQLCDDWVEQLRSAEPNDDGAALAKMHALCRAADVLLFSGHHEVAQALLAQAQQDADKRGTQDPLLHGRLSRVRGFQGYFEGELGLCVRMQRAAIERFVEAGDERAACLERINLGCALLELGAYPQAESALREALAAAQRMSIDMVVAAAKHNLGPVLAHRGDPAAGLALEQMALESFRTQGDVRLEGYSRMYLAQIHLLASAPAAAEQQARKAAAMLEAFPALCGLANALLAQSQLAQSRPHDALKAAEEGMKYLTGGGKLEAGEAMLRLVHAEALHATGAHQAAQPALQVAQSRLDERAAKINDPTLRKSFLHQVPENLRTHHLSTTNWKS